VKRAAFDDFVEGVDRELKTMRAIEIHRGLYESVTTLGADDVYDHATVWGWHYLDSFLLRGRDRVEVRDGRRERTTDAATIDWRRMTDAAEALEEAYRQHPEGLRRFHRILLDTAASGFRFTVAYLRLVEPLLHAADSGFTERHWSELSRAEWQEFLDAGIARERIALTRSDDVERANEVARGLHVVRSEIVPTVAQRSKWERNLLFAELDSRVTAVANQIWRDIQGDRPKRRGSR
jgi:hypothetical protein